MAEEGLPLVGGYLQRVSGNASLEETQNAINGLVDHLNNQLQAQIFSDGKTKRMILGYQKDGWGSGKDFGIKISQEGVDVTVATDDKLLFKMDLQTWFFYDPVNGKNFMQMGVLPDGKGGFVVVEDGQDVADAYNG